MPIEIIHIILSGVLTLYSIFRSGTRHSFLPFTLAHYTKAAFQPTQPNAHSEDSG